jgi:hypothetical protein
VPAADGPAKSGPILRKRLAATVFVVLFLMLQGFFGAPAMAQSSSDTPRLRLEVSQLVPRYVSTNSTSLSIPGKITNIGDRRIAKPVVRLEIGERLTTERQLTESMAGGLPVGSKPSNFIPVADSLEPGQSVSFTVTAPLGTGPNALQVTKTGVYPLLVNVNGTPEFGGTARLAALSMLLPVVGVPGKSPESHPKSLGLSILWPIANTVPRVATLPFRGQLLLADDDLATELSTGGRLYSLLAAAQQQSDRPLFDSLCFALDPDLVDTVELMTHGYQFRTGAGLATANGKGVEAAKEWLAMLKQLVTGHCVVALPYADADLTLLSKVKAGDQPDAALVTTAAEGANVLQRVLGVQPQHGVLWPDGSMDTKTLGMLGGAGVNTLLTDSTNLKSTGAPNAVVSLSGTDLRAQPIDALVSSALSGNKGAALRTANGSGPLATVTSQPAIAAQNGLAALAFRAGLGQSSPEPGTLVLAPPRRWNVPLAELQALLNTIGDYKTAGLVAPKTLSQLLSASGGGEATTTIGTQDMSSNASSDLSEAMSGIDTSTASLVNAMAVDATSQVKPADLVNPVHTGLIRGASTAWRETDGGTPAATFNAGSELDFLIGRVSVPTPTQTLSLASGTSPLPVFVSNTLPVTMTVRIALRNNAGLRPEAGAQNLLIPANGSVTQYVPVEALRAGRFSVDVALTTPSGTQLGTTTRFELTSNDYGTITIIVTATAAGALLLLSSRRIYRRIKESKAQRT